MAAPNSNVAFITSDGVLITVERGIAECSTLIRDLLDDLDNSIDPDEPIPIPDIISEPVIRKIIEWCTHHQNDPPSQAKGKITDISDWDQAFMRVDQQMLLEIILAADFLDIKALLDLGCKTVANIIKGGHPKEIGEMLNIQNDLTPEEDEQICRENKWAM
jgi:S-phase kinase-associated protein 1